LEQGGRPPAGGTPATPGPPLVGTRPRGRLEWPAKFAARNRYCLARATRRALGVGPLLVCAVGHDRFTLNQAVVSEIPGLGDLSMRQAQEEPLRHIEDLPGRRYPEKFLLCAFPSPLRPYQDCHTVTLGDDLIDGQMKVGKRVTNRRNHLSEPLTTQFLCPICRVGHYARREDLLNEVVSQLIPEPVNIEPNHLLVLLGVVFVRLGNRRRVRLHTQGADKTRKKTDVGSFVHASDVRRLLIA